jgi:hypothetical protein
MSVQLAKLRDQPKPGSRSTADLRDNIQNSPASRIAKPMIKSRDNNLVRAPTETSELMMRQSLKFCTRTSWRHHTTTAQNKRQSVKWTNRACSEVAFNGRLHAGCRFSPERTACQRGSLSAS